MSGREYRGVPLDVAGEAQQIIAAYTTSPGAAIIEPFDLPEEYVTGLGCVEILSDGNCRLVFYSLRRGERVAKFAMIIPVVGAIEGIAALSHEITCMTNMMRLN